MKAWILPAMLACVAAPAFADFVRITSLDEQKSFIGKKHVSPDGHWVRWKRNGKMDGRLASGEKMKGEYSWQDGYMCRTLTAGNRDFGYDCLLVEVDGKTVRVTAKQGSGRVSVWTRK